MEFDGDSKVGRIAAQAPLATRVFSRHGIDYCCGGGRPLSEACSELGLETGAVVREIEKELAGGPSDGVDWRAASARDLIEHIVASYHVPLREELSRLSGMARKVLDVHQEKDPERLGELVEVFEGLSGELLQHMEKEEAILFPMIESGRGSMAEGPISVMEAEHDDAGRALDRIRELTGDFQVPNGACNTWRALWAGLADLETSLHEHIHLENNILFPGVLDG